ncbi:MAG: amino acid ABC transporter substrate-binding protein [Rhizobiales bacterium]|nr:amino acid ABC transporter substrate-binding protein [Hyphomicrobiales bacterium]
METTRLVISLPPPPKVHSGPFGHIGNCLHCQSPEYSRPACPRILQVAPFSANIWGPIVPTIRHWSVKSLFTILVSCVAILVAPARAAEPIKIGFTLPITGSLASAGKGAAFAFDVWRDDVNARGGLLGRPVQFVSYDDRSDPSLVAGFYSKLLDADKVDLVISSYGAEQIAAAMPLVTERKLLFMALFGARANDRYNYDRYFQIAPNGPAAALSSSRAFVETAWTMQPKPQSIAIIAADAERTREIATGVREAAGVLGLKVIRDNRYSPRTVDFIPVLRDIMAMNADVIFVASNTPDSVGILRAANEIGLQAKMFGGAMAGLSLAAVKVQLGPLLNGVVAFDLFVPEPTMQFPGVEDFLRKYRARAKGVAIDPLGLFVPPFAYAQMQILEQAITAVGGFDQAKLAAHIRTAAFPTIVGEVKFGANGDWEKPRSLLVQYQGIAGHDLQQFGEPGKQVILYPPDLKSGRFIYPFTGAKK